MRSPAADIDYGQLDAWLARPGLTYPRDTNAALGMSFLNRLESFEVRGRRLVLRAKGAR